MNIPAPTKPAESIPTEGNALAVYLEGFFRYEMATANKAVQNVLLRDSATRR